MTRTEKQKYITNIKNRMSINTSYQEHQISKYIQNMANVMTYLTKRAIEAVHLANMTCSPRNIRHFSNDIPFGIRPVFTETIADAGITPIITAMRVNTLRSEERLITGLLLCRCGVNVSTLYELLSLSSDDHNYLQANKTNISLDLLLPDNIIRPLRSTQRAIASYCIDPKEAQITNVDFSNLRSQEVQLTILAKQHVKRIAKNFGYPDDKKISTYFNETTGEGKNKAKHLTLLRLIGE